MFKYNTRKEYEISLIELISDLDVNRLQSYEYSDLLDEYIEFCEVSGSGE